MSAGQDIAKEREGLRLKAYPDPGSGGAPWTIGYGHTEGVRQGDTCTIEQAEAWFQEDWAKAEAIVLAAVTVKLSPQQLDALTSFVFNVGRGKKDVKDGFVELRNGQPSTMLRKINAGDFIGAAAQFDLWTKAAGRVMSGLVIRRKKEKALFLSGTNIPESAFPQPQEKDMAPFLMAAIPALIQELPNFAKIFQNKNVAERNVEAVSKAADIIETERVTMTMASTPFLADLTAEAELRPKAMTSLRAFVSAGAPIPRGRRIPRSRCRSAGDRR